MLSEPGQPSERTLSNVRRARAFDTWAGPYHIEWKMGAFEQFFFTDPSKPVRSFRLFPKWEIVETDFHNEGPVRWFRGYWLTFGLSIYWRDKERNCDERTD